MGLYNLLPKQCEKFLKNSLHRIFESYRIGQSKFDWNIDSENNIEYIYWFLKNKKNTKIPLQSYNLFKIYKVI